MECSSILYSCLLLLCVLMCQSLACSDDGMDNDLINLVKKSDVVVYGTVTRTYPRKTRRNSVYTAEMELTCIYKGGALQPKINISMAGLVDGWCFETQFSQGNTYVALLRRDGGKFVPAAPEMEGDYELEEVTLACGVNLVYPEGKSPTTGYQCPETSPDDCVMEPDVVPPIQDTDDKEETDEEEPPYVVENASTQNPVLASKESPTSSTSSTTTTTTRSRLSSTSTEPEPETTSEPSDGDNDSDENETETGAPVQPVKGGDDNGASGTTLHTLTVVIVTIFSAAILSR